MTIDEIKTRNAVINAQLKIQKLHLLIDNIRQACKHDSYTTMYSKFEEYANKPIYTEHYTCNVCGQTWSKDV